MTLYEWLHFKKIKVHVKLLHEFVQNNYSLLECLKDDINVIKFYEIMIDMQGMLVQ